MAAALLCALLAPVAQAQEASAPSDTPEAASPTTVDDAAQTVAAPAEADPDSTASQETAAADAAAVPPSDDSPPEKSPEKQNKELAAQVRYIFHVHCIGCHNDEVGAGGLQLDTEEHLRRGGHSGRTILGGPLADNELYARVASKDRTYRMPKDSDPLSEADVETIRRWIEHGSPWFDPMQKQQSASAWQSATEKIGYWVDRYEFEYYYALPYIIAFLVIQLLVLIVLRTRAACRKGPNWTTGRWAPFCRFCNALHSRELLLIVLLSAGGLALAFARGHVLKLGRDLDKLSSRVVETTSNWSQTVYGYPPRPIRPDHEPGVTRTYYRGNCERNPELFNNGNYLTAIFRVHLCDENHHPVEIGERVPEGGLLLRCEIERAPGTTDALYTKELMKSVLFTKSFYEPPHNELKETPVPLETLAPGWRWVAYVPLGDPVEQTLEGVVYLYMGRIAANRISGVPSYAIEYRLKLSGGRLAAGSDLWMDSLGNSAFAPPTPGDKLPYWQWFGNRPLPVITGENSSDPKLLGVDEYVQKGLIKPPAEQPGDKAPRENESTAVAAEDESTEAAAAGSQTTDDEN